MSKSDWWGTRKDLVTRQEVAAAPEKFDEDTPCDEPVMVVTPRPPGKKNTRRWCKGKVGREHVLVIAVPPNHSPWRLCGWVVQRYIRPGMQPRVFYRCRHVELCRECGKVFRTRFWLDDDSSLRKEECPEFAPPPDDLV